MILVKDSLAGALFGERRPRFTAFIGGGGKTTAIDVLSREFLANGESVIITTTTKTHPPQDLSILAGSAYEAGLILKTHRLCHAGVVVIPGHKMRGLPEIEVSQLPTLCDRVLSESDGSRDRPLKAPREFEPVIPRAADAVVFVMGLDAIGKPVCEAVHCPELACELLGVTLEHIVTAGDASDLFRRFYVKKATAQNSAAELIILLNKFDGGLREKQAREMAGLLGDYRVAVR